MKLKGLSEVKRILLNVLFIYVPDSYLLKINQVTYYQSLGNEFPLENRFQEQVSP